jgi:hypothetical protein
MAREDQVRPGLAGHWDRFVGPGATTAETVGMLAFSAAGALCGAAGLDRDAALRHRLLMRAVAVDLWGGMWVNNTRSCVEWYERPGTAYGSISASRLCTCCILPSLHMLTMSLGTVEDRRSAGWHTTR